MLEGLTESLSKALRNLRGLGKLTEENMAEALAEVRKALLSADVHFKVAREFTERVKEQCIGLEVIKSVTPGQEAVFYLNGVCLGGGTIDKVYKNNKQMIYK